MQQGSAGGLAFAVVLAGDLHGEGIAPGGHPPGKVGLQGQDPPCCVGNGGTGACDLAPDGELVVEMRGAQPVEPGDLAFQPGLLHQPGVAGRDGLGERELARLVAGVFEAAQRSVAARERSFDEPRLALVGLPHRRVHAAERGVGQDLDFLVRLPWRSIRPSRCSISDGSHGTSRWCRAASRRWTLTPVPMVGEEPIRMRTRPASKAANSRCLASLVLWSCMNAISAAGTPQCAPAASLIQR